MKIVVAIDSFKGSLSSLQAGNAVKEAIMRLDGNAEVLVKPLADGGEGTVEALAETSDAEMVEIEVNGPLMKPVIAKYCIFKNTNTAVIEMAAASGITLVSPEDRNPLETTTFGVGELIKDAINRGCRRFVVGIGGSATNDGGTGMLTALGYEFLDINDKPIMLGAKGLASLHSIKTDNVMPELKDCIFNVACDVTNPLCGKDGCSAVYGPQKGADSDMIVKMDKWLSNYAGIAKKYNPDADKDYPGCGAAGGLGFAFRTFLGGELKNGIGLILEQTGIRKHIESSDIVVTGEGRLDSQTAMGKAPAGVSAIAKEYGKPVIAFSGCVTKDAGACNECGIDAFFPIVRGATSLEDAMNRENAYANIADTAEQVFRLIKTMTKLN